MPEECLSSLPFYLFIFFSLQCSLPKNAVIAFCLSRCFFLWFSRFQVSEDVLSWAKCCKKTNHIKMETLSLGWKICNHISEKKYKKPTEERQKDKKDGVVCCIEMVIWGEDIIKEFPLSRTVGDHHVSAGSGVSSSVRDHRWAGGLPSSNRPQVAAGTHLCPVPGKPLHFSVRPVWRGQHQGMSAVSEWVCVCVCVCVCLCVCVCVCVCVRVLFPNWSAWTVIRSLDQMPLMVTILLEPFRQSWPNTGL